MSGPLLIALWAAAGLLAGGAFTAYRRPSPSSRVAALSARLASTALTAALFALLASRIGYQFDLLPYSAFAALGITLARIDILEQRLPSPLVYFGVLVVGGLFMADAVSNSRMPDLLRALAGMLALFSFYLVLALIFAGQLGAGDVKLAALLGLTLGWRGWETIIAATFLGWRDCKTSGVIPDHGSAPDDRHDVRRGER
ncbi:prepilin peptidase [Amycolatopsis sp. K13G38]|uniref:Prepilin peptidase n=1 Tax=Amycolatopsis acididurans TaxID=2724524 RepID=A0ABX1JL64_9PSEU|nr:prepilin peptidase [Amycolatopsis acididurans]NKQ59002.1 prepilin peptidase [Amycolatopsis acididurans]